MRFPARKSVLMVATISFAATVTGVSLQLHLLSYDHEQEHDPDKCSVCQHFLNAPGKFIQKPESGLPAADPVKNDTGFSLYICITTLHHNPSNPRAPPPV